jgi:hypothetical protein
MAGVTSETMGTDPLLGLLPFPGSLVAFPSQLVFYAEYRGSRFRRKVGKQRQIPQDTKLHSLLP